MQRAPDGGYGWFVVAGGFLAHVIALGVLYSFGVFFPPMIDEFGQGQGATAWVISISNAVMLGAAGVTGRLAGRFGPTAVVAAGAATMTTGLFLSASATEIWQVYVAYGVLVGLGASAGFVPAVGAVGQWFDRRRGLATGIAVAGSGVGTVVLAPVSERLIDAMGWRGAARVLGVVALVVLLAAAALVRGHGDRHRSSVLRDVVGDRTFRILYLGALVGAFGYLVPFVFVVPYAEDAGLTSAQGALLLATMGAASTAGRIVLGAAADRAGRLRMLRGATVAMSAAVLLWPAATRMGPLVAFALVYGFVAGAFIALLPALTGDYYGVQRLAATAGLLYTGAALGSLLGAPAVGALFDLLDSYTPAILMAGAALAVNASLLFALPPPARIAPAADAGAP